MAVETNKPNFQYVWASGGAKVAPTDVKIQNGWGAEVPPFQWENWSQNRQDEAILHLFQKGISEWDAVSNYYFTASGVRSYVQGSDGAIYVALQDSVNQNPVSAPTYWQKAFVDLSALNAALALSSTTVGSRVNLVANIPTAATTATFTADQLVVSTTLTGISYRLNSISKAINLATVGVGGMDTGSAPVSGYVAIYAAYNPLLALSATNPMLIGQNATPAKVAEVYVGANMPAGYTATALVAVLPTNASSQFGVSYVSGRKMTVADVTAVNTSAGVTLALTSIASSVPRNAIRVSGTLAAAATTGSGGCSTTISGFSSGLGAQSTAGYSTSPNGCNTVFRDLPLATQQTIYLTTALAGPGTGLFTVTVKEYEI